jgi:hypothetical protein
MKLFSVQEILKNEVNRLGLEVEVLSHPSKVAEKAIAWDAIEGHKIPLIGGFTELESLLFRWVQRKRQILATKIHLAQMHLADSMIKDLDIPETDTQLAIATCLNWVAGQHGGEYRFLKWLVDNSARVEEIVELGSSWEWDSLRWYNASLFMGTRVDASQDWTNLFLSSRNLLTDVEALIEQESGKVETPKEPQTNEEIAEEVADEGLGKP